MTTTYGVVKEIYSLNGESRIAYGLAAYADAEEIGTTTIIEIINDITSDFNRLQELAELCNSLELCPIHLADVVDDFLYEDT